MERVELEGVELEAVELEGMYLVYLYLVELVGLGWLAEVVAVRGGGIMRGR